MSLRCVVPANPPLPFIISILNSNIQTFVGNNKNHIAYELLVTNNFTSPISIKGLKITPFKTIINETALKTMFSTISTANTLQPQHPILQPNETGIIYLFLNFNQHAKLTSIDNILYIQTTTPINPTNSITLQSIITPSLTLNPNPPILLHPPLKGKNFLCSDGPSNTSSHRKAILTFNGQLRLPQKYAIDFLQYGKYGLLDGDPLKNSSYYIYGNKVYAVADGVVIGLLDGVKENVPNTPPPFTTFQTIGGNYILIKLTNKDKDNERSCGRNIDYYAYYAHLIPGSIKVKVGDKVKAGQVLARAGNSGNSVAPHLHFQITDKPEPVGADIRVEPLNAQGRPWELIKFVKHQYVNVGMNPLFPVLPNTVKIVHSEIVKNQILMDNNLVDFC